MNDSYVLYTKPGCPWCEKAVALLEDKEIPYDTITLGTDEKLLAEVKQALRWPTFPAVFSRFADSGSLQLVGGYTDLEAKLEGGNV